RRRGAGRSRGRAGGRRGCRGSGGRSGRRARGGARGGRRGRGRRTGGRGGGHGGGTLEEDDHLEGGHVVLAAVARRGRGVVIRTRAGHGGLLVGLRERHAGDSVDVAQAGHQR